MSFGEFDVIDRYFRPLSGPGGLNLEDDSALLRPEPNKMLAVSTDTMVENVHFFPDDPVETIGRKLLRCNLSDMAAMGARPFAYTLNLALPERLRSSSEEWFALFSQGLAEDQARFDLQLIGGDTTSTSGPLVLTATIYGSVGIKHALRRNAAKPGDCVWVTGTIGDAALGLKVLQGAMADPSGILVQRYRLPEPRLVPGLSRTVHAAMDVSDGLVQDCRHLARASGVSITLEAELVPLSDAARSVGASPEMCFTGGDDYELLLAVPSQKTEALREIFARCDIPVTLIGRVEAGAGVHVLDKTGGLITFMREGWQHF